MPLPPARKLVLYALHTGHQNYAFHHGYKRLTMNRLKYGPHTLQVPTILRYQIYTLECLSTSAKSRKKAMETIVHDTKSLHRKPSNCKTQSLRNQKRFDTPLLIDGIKSVRNQPVCNSRGAAALLSKHRLS